jgi:Mannosylglycerate hydrolase MGH1-like glycoside hydrolase domain
MNRRAFLAASVWIAAGRRLQTDSPASRLEFETSDETHSKTYNAALDVLARNTIRVSGYPEPVLIEGANYSGIWLECAPQEGLVYSDIRPDIARNNHLAFFALQREDGQLPCWSRTTAAGFAQIQMVVPIAGTAWELSQKTGDHELLEKAYAGASRWDGWLRHYRNTRGTGLCEGFCTYDTGHDNSPRWSMMPNACPGADARNLPPVPSLPRLCPDLSATVYGGRVALAEMARALGKNSEADRWKEDAEAIRSRIIDRLYVAGDAAFYDVDRQDRFVRIRGDVNSRVLGEHVVDRKLFNTMYERQIHNPNAFWAPYPLPSIALDDPAFVRPITRNSWGGPSQALTALRAPRWMEYYGKPSDLAYLMQQWNDAILRDGKFHQQIDPADGTFTNDGGGYSPAALVLVDFTWRLAGVRREGDTLEWNVRPPFVAVRSRYRLKIAPSLTAELRYSSGRAELFLNDKLKYRTNSVVRIVTDMEGNLRGAVGIAPAKSSVVLELASQRRLEFSLQPNASRRL